MADEPLLGAAPIRKPGQRVHGGIVGRSRYPETVDATRSGHMVAMDVET
jgi:hypothetical protein